MRDGGRGGELASALGLDRLIAQPFVSLSSGEHRRLLIGEALCAEPRVLVLDEPFDGLDRDTRTDVHAVLEEAGQRTTMVLITHREEEVPDYVTHVAVLGDGGVKKQGARADMQGALSEMRHTRQRPPCQNGQPHAVIAAQEHTCTPEGRRSSIEHSHSATDERRQPHTPATTQASSRGSRTAPSLTDTLDTLTPEQRELVVEFLNGGLSLDPNFATCGQISGNGATREQTSGDDHENSSENVLLEMSNVTVSYDGRCILPGVSWRVRSGENWALTGPNGCGKSTLVRLAYSDHPQRYSNDVSIMGRRSGSGASIWQMRETVGIVTPWLHLQHHNSPFSAHAVSHCALN
jgi:ABC-type molybdenum transport system ATPase subunit/photorepair protein PhrA